MIRAIITDVDGVLVGKTHGVNFPIPHEQVLTKLKLIHESGLPVILCSGKSLNPITPIIEKAKLANWHITDGGSVISDPLTNEVITHAIKKNVAKNIVSFAFENTIYTELYACGKYFIQQDKECSYTEQHTKIMQQEPERVTSLLDIARKEDIVKILLFIPSSTEKPFLENYLGNMQNDVNLYWGLHPTMLPAQAAIITAQGVSKKHASEEVIKKLRLSFNEILGIGDASGDWAFMQLCKYAAVVGNESEELKNLVKEKGEGNYFFAPDVEENGVLKVFEFFKI